MNITNPFQQLLKTAVLLTCLITLNLQAGNLVPFPIQHIQLKNVEWAGYQVGVLPEREGEYIPFPLFYSPLKVTYPPEVQSNMSISLSKSQIQTEAYVKTWYYEGTSYYRPCTIYQASGDLNLNNSIYKIEKIIYFHLTKELMIIASQKLITKNLVQVMLTPQTSLGDDAYRATYTQFEVRNNSLYATHPAKGAYVLAK